MSVSNETKFDQVFKARIAELEKKARANGLNLTLICTQAGVSRATPDRWKRQVPKTIKILSDMERIVDEHIASLPPLQRR